MKTMVGRVFQEPANNPYKNWHGQGNLADMNLNHGKWRKARQYLYLQRKDRRMARLVKELPGHKPYTYSFLFHESAINAYFESVPHKLPVVVPRYRPRQSERDRRLRSIS